MPLTDVQNEYVHKLWKTYDEGVKKQKLDPEDLFVALIKDLIEQVQKDRPTSPAERKSVIPRWAREIWWPE